MSEGKVKITYTPLGKLQKTQDKEKVVLNIKDGDAMSIELFGVVQPG